uniref:General odorant-binding protein 83a n=1 Tax=Cacopsylla melanoneura TaxID=428564 RepID=A0A8D8YWD4_9HEMI
MFFKSVLSLLVLNSATFLLHCSAEMDESMKAVVKMIHDQCIDDTGVGHDVIDRIFATKNLENDDKFKCYLACTLQQISAMDEEGNVDPDVFTGTVPEEYKPYAESVIEHCKEEGGANACEKAYNLNVCAQKVDPSKYMLI